MSFRINAVIKAHSIEPMPDGHKTCAAEADVYETNGSRSGVVRDSQAEWGDKSAPGHNSSRISSLMTTIILQCTVTTR